MAYEVQFEPDALRMLGAISDRRIRALITRRASRLVEEPEKQGKPLSRSMSGFRTVRVVGQRYRIIYRVDRNRELVQVIALGLRRGSGKKDVYSMAERVAERVRRFPSD
jgi:mRNA interferase RelE/StbE